VTIAHLIFHNQIFDKGKYNINKTEISVLNSEIFQFHFGGCYAMLTGKYIAVLQRIVVPPSSGSRGLG